MKKKSVLLVLFLFSFVILISAQEKPNITVLDFSVDSVSESEMRSIINVLSSALFKSGYFTVIDVSQREKILKEMEFSASGCSDESCMLEIGKMLSAEGIVVGSIGKVGSRYVLSAKLLETETGAALSTADGIYADLDALLDGIGVIALELGSPYGSKDEVVEKAPAVTDQTATVTEEKQEAAVAVKEEKAAGKSKAPAWITLAGGVGCLGAGGYFLAVSLPLILDYLDAQAAYDEATDFDDFDGLYNAVVTAQEAAVDGNANLNVVLGGSLAAAGIGLGVLSAILFASAGNTVEDGAVAAAVLPVPGGALLSFHVRY